MKICMLVIALILGAPSVNAQTYKTEFRADMCACLEQESLKRTLTNNAIKICLRETLPEYATQIDAQIIEPDLNKKFQKGQIARKDLLIAMYSELIYTCDVYYQHIDFQRTSKKLIAQENTKENDLDKYDQVVALRPNAAAYFMRAEVHFKLGNIKAAEADLIKSLELNPKRENAKATRNELLSLAWVYEEQKRYTEAIALYDKIYFGDLDTKVAQLRALADKKAGNTITNKTRLGEVELQNEIQKMSSAQTRRKGTLDKTVKKPSKKKNTNNSKVKKNKDTTALRKLFKIGNG
ncbi:MAG: tetratricopeptide repeat protein [Winogradskyella sp.]|uniref:tetratricopeptide repeat protein n=1 Tax=Winogradskyella sp. TaxID=1883156 RepID=UPI00385AB75E